MVHMTTRVGMRTPVAIHVHSPSFPFAHTEWDVTHYSRPHIAPMMRIYMMVVEHLRDSPRIRFNHVNMPDTIEWPAVFTIKNIFCALIRALMREQVADWIESPRSP